MEEYSTNGVLLQIRGKGDFDDRNDLFKTMQN